MRVSAAAAGYADLSWLRLHRAWNARSLVAMARPEDGEVQLVAPVA
eukprot:gene18605-18698_t